jgi:CCR4-NOT complex subunit CAF16
MAPTVEISHLSFTYPGIDGRPPPGAPPLIEDVCFSLDAGQRCLLLGSNGAGNPYYLLFHLPLRFSRLSLGVD